MGIVKNNLNRCTGFIGSTNSYDKADIVIIGAPMDYTVSFKPGSRFGPQKIRELSWELETYSPYLKRDLEGKNYFDYGDLELPFGNVAKSLDIIGEAAEEIILDGKKPIFIGGEHLISLPIIRKIHAYHGEELVILHFDAHTDLRGDYYKESNSHATVMKHVAGFIKPKNIYQFGIRSGLREEFLWAEKNTNLFIDEVYQPLISVIENIKNKPLYITLDIDVLDPAFAPGTGTPEAGGITARELLRSIHILKDCNVVGMDLVEVLPMCDAGDITSAVAAKIIRECLLSFF